MTKSAMIKEKIMQLLSDGSPHSVSEMKDYLVEKEMEDYSEGQFAGSVDNLLKNKKIEKVDRGTYRIAGAEMVLTKERNGVFMKKCFAVIISMACILSGTVAVFADVTNLQQARTVLMGEPYNCNLSELQNKNAAILGASALVWQNM